MKQFKSKCPELKIELKRGEVKKAQIRTSKDCNDFFRSIWDDTIDIYESFYCIFLNQNNNTIGWFKASQGGITGTVADPRIIFKKALDCLATGIIVCHNHPSGQLKPSNADIEMTEKIKGASKFLDIRLIEHIILTSEDYYSFNDNGLI